MFDTVSTAPSSPSVPSARQLPVVVVGAAVAGGRLVLWYPLSIFQVGPAVWDVTSGRVRLVLPQQLRLDVGDEVLLRSGRLRKERSRRWESPLILIHPQVLWVTPP